MNSNKIIQVEFKTSKQDRHICRSVTKSSTADGYSESLFSSDSRSDFLRLYPGANILAATKKDFEPANRKKFCSRIATGDYDAVIIGHSQFEKIPLSQERQVAILERQIDEIETAIALAKAEKGERYTIKQMEKSSGVESFPGGANPK